MSGSDMSSFGGGAGSGGGRASSDMGSAAASSVMNTANRSSSSFSDSVCSGSPGPPYASRKDLPEDLAFFLQQQKQRQV